MRLQTVRCVLRILFTQEAFFVSECFGMQTLMVTFMMNVELLEGDGMSHWPIRLPVMALWLACWLQKYLASALHCDISNIAVFQLDQGSDSCHWTDTMGLPSA